MSTEPPNSSGADYSFPKHLRLKGKKEISELFSDGSFFYLGPFKVYYLIREREAALTRILISVPKSKFSKANKRNRIKRLIREAFRLNKEILFGANHDLNLMIDKFALVYLDRDLKSLEEIETKLKSVLERLNSILQKEHAKN
ncbi:ribonuclease P protein component [Hyphobacterium sp. CCMP332]|nr:ribonuclease P protein component [Hyphobacterium sp. CCMP332]